MAEWNSLFDDAQRLAGEQFEAAWKLHVERVSETLESGWRDHIARVVEQRFTSLKNDLGAANEVYLAERLEQEVQAKLNDEWHARMADHKLESQTEEFEQRVAASVEWAMRGTQPSGAFGIKMVEANVGRHSRCRMIGAAITGHDRSETRLDGGGPVPCGWMIVAGR